MADYLGVYALTEAVGVSNDRVDVKKIDEMIAQNAVHNSQHRFPLGDGVTFSQNRTQLAKPRIKPTAHDAGNGAHVAVNEAGKACGSFGFGCGWCGGIGDGVVQGFDHIG